LIEHYKEYADNGGVVKLTKAQLEDPSQHHYKNTEDLNYTHINYRVILAFLTAHKVLPSKQYRSNSDLHKFHFAILFGAREFGAPLPVQYHQEVGADFLQPYKKESIKKKQAGLMDEHGSDPITYPFFHQICAWALDAGLIFILVFSLLQWNCMARSINIDRLGFRNLSVGTDSIKVTYDNNKADQEGEKVTPKNLNASPLDPVSVFFLRWRFGWHCIRRCSYRFLLPSWWTGGVSSRKILFKLDRTTQRFPG
jgi:hypothetical protein